mmetsp:Transcript_28645/g.41813  ORF Transcript_28645/g.41813 Transcript_28645/m.41813 type:complete len:114 (-) Transcript_28645:603-944(-)
MSADKKESTSDNSDGNATMSPSEALTECLLSQYQFCAGGVGLGAAYGIKYAKGPIPMVIGGITGTVGDLIYGSMVACATQVDTYRADRSGDGKMRAESIVSVVSDDDDLGRRK